MRGSGGLEGAGTQECRSRDKRPGLSKVSKQRVKRPEYIF